MKGRTPPTAAAYPYVMHVHDVMYGGKTGTRPTADIYVYDSHGEYPIPDRTQSEPAGVYRVTTVFDTYEITDALADCAVPPRKRDGLGNGPEDNIVKEFVKTHFPQFELLQDFGRLIQLNGTLKDHDYTFTKWVTDDLENGCTGSDDDFFDYWPGAMEMAYAYALALNEFSKSKKYTYILKRSYLKAVDRRPDICNSGDEAWHYPDKNLMKKLWRKYDQ